jgi:uncharacterized oxidoreductase
MPKFNREMLVELSEKLFKTAGVRADDAATLATILVKAEERGYAGHGVVRVPFYLERIENGQVRVDGQPRIVRNGRATAVLDGDLCFGQVAGVRAVELAISKAEEHGVGAVGLIRSGHIGRLADYVEIAADRGMIGIAMVSVGGSVAPYGGREPVTGTNPVAYAIPGPAGQHILLDFATAAMSQGDLQHRVAIGEPIPSGVMIDAAGNPTTDYRTYAGPPRGALLPFGGYKGSGLLLMADILGGLLPGDGPGIDRGKRGQAGGNAALFQVIDVAEFQPLEAFEREIASFADFVRSRPPAPGFDAVLVPGDRARLRAQQSVREGIAVADSTWTQLEAWAEKLGVPIPNPG